MRIFIDMDNVLVDFKSGIDQLSDDLLLKYKGRYKEVPGIFALMAPMPDAIKSYEQLAIDHDVFILSTAPWGNPSAWGDKLLWVQKHLGDVARKRLILSHHKYLLRGDLLIDDRRRRGAGAFTGRHLHFGPDGEFETWSSILDEIEELV